jgi:hypothetical protein
MKEHEIRQRIEGFLKRTARELVVPASVGLGLALVGCDHTGIKVARDAAADTALSAAPDAIVADATLARESAANVPDVANPRDFGINDDRPALDAFKADLPNLMIPYGVYIRPDAGPDAPSADAAAPDAVAPDADAGAADAEVRAVDSGRDAGKADLPAIMPPYMPPYMPPPLPDAAQDIRADLPLVPPPYLGPVFGPPPLPPDPPPQAPEPPPLPPPPPPYLAPVFDAGQDLPRPIPGYVVPPLVPSPTAPPAKAPK